MAHAGQRFLLAIEDSSSALRNATEFRHPPKHLLDHKEGCFMIAAWEVFPSGSPVRSEKRTQQWSRNMASRIVHSTQTLVVHPVTSRYLAPPASFECGL